MPFEKNISASVLMLIVLLVLLLILTAVLKELLTNWKLHHQYELE